MEREPLSKYQGPSGSSFCGGVPDDPLAFIELGRDASNKRTLVEKGSAPTFTDEAQLTFCGRAAFQLTMSRSATDTVQDIINAAIVDAIVALKDASKGLPNALLRDVNAIHANTAFADLPEAVRSAVASSVRDAFVRLRKEG